MPQLDLLSFLSQFFWFSIGFWALYVVLFKYFLIPTSMSLKIREYLSNEKNASSSKQTALLSEEISSELDKVYVSYSNFTSKAANSTFSNIEKLMTGLDKTTKSYIISSTDRKAIDYALKKATLDFLLAKKSSK